MSNITRALSISGLTSITVGIAADRWAKKHYPPHDIPLLPPQRGYKIFGYMGCPASKVKMISERKRNLFFADNLETPQRYALARTSFWDRCVGKDQPVVLQLEIREGDQIKPEEYWHDEGLTHPMSLVPHHVSFYPALPPKIQEKYDLHLRVHHVVTCDVQRHGGALCRAFHDFREKIGNKK